MLGVVECRWMSVIGCHWLLFDIVGCFLHIPLPCPSMTRHLSHLICHLCTMQARTSHGAHALDLLVLVAHVYGFLADFFSIRISSSPFIFFHHCTAHGKTSLLGSSPTPLAQGTTVGRPPFWGFLLFSPFPPLSYGPVWVPSSFLFRFIFLCVRVYKQVGTGGDRSQQI